MLEANPAGQQTEHAQARSRNVNSILEELQKQGQSIWCDNLGREMLDGGELRRLIDLGVLGVTSNPTIFMKAITQSSAYDKRIDEWIGDVRDTVDLYERLVLCDIADAADLLRPVYDRTNGVDGFVSLEVNPKLANDTDATLAEAKRLFGILNRPNVMIKVPATHAGIPAIETLIAEGMNINITLIFGRNMYERVMQAYLSGLGRLVDAGGDLARVASVASFFVSRIDTRIDKELAEKQQDGTDVEKLLGKTAIASAKLAYARFEEVFSADGAFGKLADRGARVQRPLWASTSTKNPDYSPTLYVDALVGRSTVNTLPPDTLEMVLKGSTARSVIRDGWDDARKHFDRLDSLGIDMENATSRLLEEGVASFAQSFDELIANLEAKQSQLRVTG